MKKRDQHIDILRGISIITMIAANSAPSLLVRPHPLYFRIYGTFAAAIFTFLSGAMISLGIHEKNYKLKYYTIRSFMFLLIGCLIDLLVWRMTPFVTYDILYLIGLSTPIIYLFYHINNYIAFLCGCLFIILGSFFQTTFGYYIGYAQPPILLSELDSGELFLPSLIPNLLNNIFVSGDFPIFPWTGVGIIGSCFGKLRYTNEKWINTKGPLIGSLFILGFGIILWCSNPGLLLPRGGFSELFYPATTSYLITALGLILTLINIIDMIPDQKLNNYNFFSNLGQSSLFVYWLHELLIKYVFNQIFNPYKIEGFLFVYILLLMVVYAVTRLLNQYKPIIKKWAFPIRFILSA